MIMGLRILNLQPNVNSLKYQEDYEKNKEIRKKTSKFNLPHIMKLGKSIVEKSEIHNTLIKRSSKINNLRDKINSNSRLSTENKIHFFGSIKSKSKSKSKKRNKISKMNCNNSKEIVQEIKKFKSTRNIDLKSIESTKDSKENIQCSTNLTTITDKNLKNESKNNNILITDFDYKYQKNKENGNINNSGNNYKINSTKEKYSRFLNTIN